MRMYPALLLVVGLSLSACDDPGGPDPGGPSPGTLVVSTSTEGDDPDQDGYLLTVDDVDSLNLDPTGTVQVDLAPGRHTLRLLGVAGHCSVTPGTPLDMDLPSRDTTSVAFEVTCSATGARITTTTTGLDFDPDGYHVTVDGSDRGAITANDTVPIRLAPGSRIVDLTGLAPNCTIAGPVSRTVTIVDAEVAPVEFAVVCTATSGVIGVVISGSGVGAMHQATVDGGAPFPVGPVGRAYLAGVPAGDHVVSLTSPATCSVNTDQQSVTVTAGSLIRDTVEVTFSVTCVPAGLNVTGNWQLSTTSTVPGMPPAMIAGSITQSGRSLNGAVHVDGSDCFDQLTTIDLTGALAESNISLTSTSVAGQVITFTGSISNSALTGTYAISGGCANGDQGNVTGLKVPAINGTWRIIFDVNEQHAGLGRATLTQGSPSPAGSFGVTGSATNSIVGSSCYSGTITAGTFPSPSFIIGRSVALEIETDDGTVVFRGTVNEAGTEIIGHHQVFGGTCDGYFGGACLGRDLQRSCHVPFLRPEQT